MFRDENGRVSDSFKLTLYLSDFICEEKVPTLPGCKYVEIEITAEQLCDIYDRAVKKQIKENERKNARAASRAAASRSGSRSLKWGAINGVSQTLRRSDRLAGKTGT